MVEYMIRIRSLSCFNQRTQFVSSHHSFFVQAYIDGKKHVRPGCRRVSRIPTLRRVWQFHSMWMKLLMSSLVPGGGILERKRAHHVDFRKMFPCHKWLMCWSIYGKLKGWTHESEITKSGVFFPSMGRRILLQPYQAIEFQYLYERY